MVGAKNMQRMIWILFWGMTVILLYHDLYVQPKELQDEAPKRKLNCISEVQARGGFQHFNSHSDREKSGKRSRSRHNKDWIGLMRREAEAPALQSFVVKSTFLEEKTQSKADCDLRPPSLQPSVQRKRCRADEKQKTKRDLASKIIFDAPRQLLQSAMRDAVASNSGIAMDPSLKRLRYVVSASSGELVEQPWRMQAVSRVANPLIKAVGDEIKVESLGSVFDRLGCAMNLLDRYNELEDHYHHQEHSQLLYLHRDNNGIPYTSNLTMMEHETDFNSEETSDDEGFDEVNVMGRRVTGASQFGSSSVNMDDDSLMVNYCVPENADDGMHLIWNRDQEQPAAAHSTSKIVNVSVNVNSWNHPGPPQPREVAELDSHEILGEIRAPTYGLQTVKLNAKAVKENPASGLKKRSQRAQLSTSGSGAAVCPLEDPDSRTIFTSNVHFAATKDALSQHFNKFGEVLKVVIVTDVKTSQPKGLCGVHEKRCC